MFGGRTEKGRKVEDKDELEVLDEEGAHAHYVEAVDEVQAEDEGKVEGEAENMDERLRMW